jgi:CheY-like chemotaxis protein
MVSLRHIKPRSKHPLPLPYRSSRDSHDAVAFSLLCSVRTAKKCTNMIVEPKTRGTIVVAEDDAATRLLLRRILTRARFSVHLCENGKLACEAVRRERPDIVLLDWMMPVMDGLSAATQLKADVDTRSIPVILITTHSQIEDRDCALKVGVQDFITKPFDAVELIACIEQQMRWRAIIVGARAVGRRGSSIDRSLLQRTAKPQRTNSCPV